MKLKKSQRDKLLQMFEGKCAYCGCVLGKGWCADHILPVYRKNKQGMWHPERDTEENLFPCCRACNIHKQTHTLEGWREELERIVGILQRGYPTYKHAVRFNQVVETPSKVVFWFERFKKEIPA